MSLPQLHYEWALASEHVYIFSKKAGSTPLYVIDYDLKSDKPYVLKEVIGTKGSDKVDYHRIGAFKHAEAAKYFCLSHYWEQHC